MGCRLQMNTVPDHTTKSTLPPEKNRGRRLLSGLGWCAAAVFGLIVFVLFSVWIEHRFPSGDKKRALLPMAQRAVTRPIVDAISHEVERYVRSQAEAQFMYDSLSLEEIIARFLDDRVDLGERRLYAYRLARDGSPAAIEALLKVLNVAPPEHKAFMIELVGTTRNPAAKSWLWLMLDDRDKRVVLATIRGLSSIGGDDVTGRIAGILADQGSAEEIRIEAALGLGRVGTPLARTRLIDALNQAPSEALTAQILGSLGRFEFSEIAQTFEQYLASPKTSNSMRVAAVEALAASSSEAVPFLMKLVGDAADSDVRASAAWAISAHQGVNGIGRQLTDLAEKESTADVRSHLYEALLVQESVPAERLLPLVEAEDDIEARVAGFNAIGYASSQKPGSATAATFDEKIVPELLQIATRPNSLNIQMRAVFALRRAQTAAARSALSVIANTDNPQIANAARHGLPNNQ